MLDMTNYGHGLNLTVGWYGALLEKGGCVRLFLRASVRGATCFSSSLSPSRQQLRVRKEASSRTRQTRQTANAPPLRARIVSTLHPPARHLSSGARTTAMRKISVRAFGSSAAAVLLCAPHSPTRGASCRPYRVTRLQTRATCRRRLSWALTASSWTVRIKKARACATRRAAIRATPPPRPLSLSAARVAAGCGRVRKK